MVSKKHLDRFAERDAPLRLLRFAAKANWQSLIQCWPGWLLENYWTELTPDQRDACYTFAPRVALMARFHRLSPTQKDAALLACPDVAIWYRWNDITPEQQDRAVRADPRGALEKRSYALSPDQVDFCLRSILPKGPV